MLNVAAGSNHVLWISVSRFYLPSGVNLGKRTIKLNIMSLQMSLYRHYVDAFIGTAYQTRMLHS